MPDKISKNLFIAGRVVSDKYSYLNYARQFGILSFVLYIAAYIPCVR